MIAPSLQYWRAEFTRSARDAKRDELRKKLEQDLREDDRRDQKRELQESDVGDIVDMVVMATIEQLADFSKELDRYDTATVEAMMENRARLEKVQAELEEMLGKAYVLPDGRRIFKSADGKRVYDENGVELKPEDIDPDLIESWRPRFEDYWKGREAEKSLMEERADLADFDERVREARRRMEEGDLTSKDLEDIREDLAENAPPAVARRMSNEPEAPAAHVEIPKATMNVTVGPGMNLDLQ